MDATTIFAGPILRRADTSMVTVWLATTIDMELALRVRQVGHADWIGQSANKARLHVCENLWVHLIVAAPTKGKFPTNTLLEYSIAVPDGQGNEDHAPFAKVAVDEKLVYPGHRLPTFYLQGPGSKLNALYVSCRKIHDDEGGPLDAMTYGDSLIFNNVDSLAARPTILCLTGDQIYADDVHDKSFEVVKQVAAKLEGAATETLPNGLDLPGVGQRQKFVKREACFTSTYAKNHLVTFAEFAAMYGMAWSRANWPAGSFPSEIDGYVTGLPKVRRLLANTPTYMIFDDHDVTDDWNLSLDWINGVRQSAVGVRILTNALYAFWLFQAWGNDPDGDAAFLPKMVQANARRLDSTTGLDAELLAKSRANGWEFFTPTYPFIYFLDTRTQRGHYDGFGRTQTKAPAYLKSIDAWKLTLDSLTKLLRRQGVAYPLVLVAPAPIWGYETIDTMQRGVSNYIGPYPFDLEGWAANRGHLLTFLLQCGNTDVVVLSGDVHYSFTTTGRFSVFDSDFFRTAQKTFPGFPFPKTGAGSAPTYQFLYASRFLQLTASASKNYASVLLAEVSRYPGGHGHIVDEMGGVAEGVFKNGQLFLAHVEAEPPHEKVLRPVTVEAHKPLCAMHQRVNDAANSAYLDMHNIGIVSITGRKVENAFLVDGKQHSRRTWDFATDSSWTPTP